MSIERRITFIIGSEGFAAWKLNRLKTLVCFFRSVIILQNITTGEAANAEHTLKVMSLGCKKNDLCQLWIEGSDAELACMILTDFIAEQFKVVNTSHKHNKEQSDSLIQNHPTFRLPFSIHYIFDNLQVNDATDKNTLISKLSITLNKKKAAPIRAAMLQREKISSTGIGNNIAIPHIMLEGVKQPAMAVLQLDTAINWGSKLGKINLIIAILIPAPATQEVVKAFTQITRALLEPTICNILTSTIEPEAMKAILFHIMARDNTQVK